MVDTLLLKPSLHFITLHPTTLHYPLKFHMIYISFNNDRHPVTKTFTPLHYTSPNYTSLPSHFASIMRRPWPTTDCCAMKKNIYTSHI